MQRKRILVLSYYFEPDLSACSFRSSSLVEHLAKLYPNIDIDVFSTNPSRYTSFNPESAKKSSYPNVSVHRIDVPNINVGFKGELLSFAYYLKYVIKSTRKKHYDLVYGTSAKLGTATLARYIGNKKSAAVFLDIRDLFVENIKDMFNPLLVKVLLPILTQIQKYTFNDVDRINIVSYAFEPYVKKYISDTRLRIFTNGIDETFQFIEKKYTHKGSLRLLYAGNIGRAQSLEKIIPDVAKILKDSIEITIVGDGRKNSKLISLLEESNISNVTIHPPVPREQLVNFYSQADMLFLHLDDCECLTRVIPSKVFEYAATGLPILCGVSGFTGEFIKENIKNAVVFSPNDATNCIEKMGKLTLLSTRRDQFCTEYSRHSIMTKMAHDIAELLYGAENT